MSSTKIAMAQPHSFQSGAFSFMSCTSGRESSPLDETTSHQPNDFKSETKKKRFHPLRNLRRMFRRKTRRSSISADSYQPGVPDNPEITSTNLEQRSCSTSRLQEENLTHNLIRNSRLNPGLSLSHDSIFTPDRADSGLSSSDLENSSLSITVLTTPSKGCPIKSQSSCSETSLLSIGSSEAELSPTRSGKLSDLDVGVTAYKLSHSAAKHKMAVKPRRNHGAPRNRRRPMVSTSPLPTTLETGEESAADRSSPQPTPDIAMSPSSPKIDKLLPEAKISWSQLSAESNAKDTEVKSDKTEDESDSRKEETNQKAESFFGRFLSRRSDKKKKHMQELSAEETEEEKHHYIKKSSKPVEIRGRVAKSPNRRQRVEPVEIPFGLNQKLEKLDKGEGVKKKPPSPASPCKSYWQTPLTSLSISPPKVIWPENSAQVKPIDGDKSKAEFSDPTENVKKDLRNADFVKELTDCVNLLNKEVSGKRKVDEEDGEAAVKIRRQHSEEVTPQKLSTPEVPEPKTESASSESITSVQNFDDQNTDDDANVKKNPSDLDFRTFPVSYETIHDGYENIQIIELVKQEVKNSEPPAPEVEKKPVPETVQVQEEKPTETEMSTEKCEKEPEVAVRKVKPLVLEKPKDLKKGQDLKLNRVPLSPDDSDVTEKIIPKARTTLVERRKSELFMMTESEEKDWKVKMKPLKKQTSFSETTTDKGKFEEGKKIATAPEKTETSEAVEEVVFRKKSTSVSDEQPELMKVFARRSLKVRESEKLTEEMQKSRDSDKENEAVESPKEERKKVVTEEERKEGESEGNKSSVREKAIEEVLISVPLVKPEIASRKGVPHRYGRSLSENNAKSREESREILEENKLNNLKSVAETCKSGSGEKEGEEKKEETGFKRIQQRKAEWERRAQQGAK